MSIHNASHYDTERKHYDMIIIGGEAAGWVLAARLSEDAKPKVLLPESVGSETDPRCSPGVQRMMDFMTHAYDSLGV